MTFWKLWESVNIRTTFAIAMPHGLYEVIFVLLTHTHPNLRVYKSIPVNTEGSYIQLVLQPNNLYRLKPAPLFRVYKSIPATRCRVMTRIGPKLCGYTKVYPQPQRIFESCCKVAPATLPILWVYKSIPATAFGFGYLESCPRKHRRRLGINT